MMAAHEARFQAGSASTSAENYGQFFYARKTGSVFAAEMARSVRVALQNWRGERLSDKQD